MNLNLRAARLVDAMLADADALKVAAHSVGDAVVVDCGIATTGGLEAGRRMAGICLAGLGDVSLAPPQARVGPWPTVAVRTDQPVLACLASQYAGWKLAQGKFFAMGSGPMRSAAASERLFDDLKYGETAGTAVGVLETRKPPPAEIIAEIAAKCRVPTSAVRLLIAPTASLAGTLQVVARAVETALHKLHELKFDLARVVSAYGVAPLPPVAQDDLAAIGRTNDAVLYGGDVTLWVRGDYDSLAAVGPRVPSNSSSDYGVPFAEIFRRYDHDFYRIDPQLFSPAAVTFVNLDTGRTLRFGEINAEVLQRSFDS